MNVSQTRAYFPVYSDARTVPCCVPYSTVRDTVRRMASTGFRTVLVQDGVRYGIIPCWNCTITDRSTALICAVPYSVLFPTVRSKVCGGQYGTECGTGVSVRYGVRYVGVASNSTFQPPLNRLAPPTPDGTPQG